MFNPQLILPEYCISVRFVCDAVKGGRGAVTECSDEELMEMDPQPQNRPKLAKPEIMYTVHCTCTYTVHVHVVFMHVYWSSAYMYLSLQY